MTQPTNQVPDADDFLLGGGAPSASLKNIGDTVEGFVVAKDVVQEKEYQRPGSNQPPRMKTWQDGSPVLQLVVTYQTALRDPERAGDDGRRKVYFKPSWKSELAKVLRANGEKTLPVGSWQRITRSHDEPGQGAEPKKMVTIEYRSKADQVATNAAPAAAAANEQSPELKAALAVLQAQGITQ
ncbi:hypothetical protein [Nocardia jiangxiensis]|uniref:hypothetical protein n=1 Tax=Nocardia jiangxiensis TaxID=282685 RepID=UPI0003034B13|nr:hypothetical protein [Nocardia jiangxiensis]